jgi:potassium/chloride transporter 9
MMQLACILHMVSDWKKATSVRVFMCVDSKVRDASLIHRNWEQMLQMLRIDATIHVVIWDHVTSAQESRDETSVHFATASHASSGIDDSFRSRASISTERRHFPLNPKDENFLKNVNTMIQEHSSSTAVVLMYLPMPSNQKNERKKYLQRLDTLTANLPPTLLVHGISPVTSITL